MIGVWAGVNRCVVCGGKLRFEKSSRGDAEKEEGARFCENNHKRFSVYGGYDRAGNWQFTFTMPIKGARHAAHVAGTAT